MSGSQFTETETNAGASEFMLFGVRVVVDSMRKSVSLNNLSQYQHRDDAGADNVVGNMAVDYASADETIHNSSTNTNTNTNSVTNRERKRGVPWTEEEHKLFLAGLQKVGKGDWRGISRIFVKTRTPTQVASHAQKYFLRRSNLNRRRRRSSLFDITTDSVAANSSNDQMSKESVIRGIEIQSNQSPQEQQLGSSIMQADSFEMPNNNVKFTLSPSPIYNPLAATQVVSPAASSSKSMIDFNLNTNTNTNTSSLLSFDPSPLSLNLSLSMSTEASKATAFQVMQGFRNPDGMISVS